MKTIYKYKLEINGVVQDLCLPKGATILSSQLNRGEVCLWALVPIDKEGNTIVRNFVIYGTGHDMPDNPGQYIGTVQHPMVGGVLVWHIFEVLK